MNVAFISDMNQIYYALTNALMIERQTKAEITTNLILIDIEEKIKNNVDSIIKKINLKSIKLIYLDSNEMSLGESKIDHITNTTNVRLYISSILSDINNVLYLDNDIVVDGDISEIFEKLSPEHSYGRPWSRWNGWVLLLKLRRMLKSKWYVNAGVLFLDLDMMRKNDLETKLINFLDDKRIKFADQDVLNCNIDFKPMPHTWNIARDKWERTMSDVAKESNLKIYHFLSTEKQWGNLINGEKMKKSKGSLTRKELVRMKEPQMKWKKYYEEVKGAMN